MSNIPCRASADEKAYDIEKQRSGNMEDEFDDVFRNDAESILQHPLFAVLSAERILENGLSDQGIDAYRKLIYFLSSVDETVSYLTKNTCERFDIVGLSEAYKETQEKFSAPDPSDGAASRKDYEIDLMSSLLYDNNKSSIFIRQCVASYAAREAADNDNMQDVIDAVGELVLGGYPENAIRAKKTSSPSPGV